MYPDTLHFLFAKSAKICSCFLFSFCYKIFDFGVIMVYYTIMKRIYKKISLKKKNRIVAIVSYILTAGLIFNTTTIPAQAAMSKEETIKQSVSEIINCLEDAINISYKKAEEEIKKSIVEEGLDYYLTMESYYQQINPYKKADYLKLISSYMVVKENKKILAESDLYSLPYIQILIEKETMAGVQYGKVTVKGMDYKDILEFYKMNEKEYLEQCEKKCAHLGHIINGEGLNQSVFLTMQQTLKDEQVLAYIQKLLNSDIADNRKQLIGKAITLVGKVPYEWGGKAKFPGYDTQWWSIDENGLQKGLDCSGYIQWCFMTANYSPDIYNQLISTEAILQNTNTIISPELEPGDLGLLNEGQTVNHVGMYLGEGYWIHCASAQKTVVIEKTNMFTIFKKMPEKNDYIADTEITIAEYKSECFYSEEDIYLLAQLIYNEANIEGMNGWIAVAEVIKNRLNSEIFPDTIPEIIYQKNPTQFADNHKIKTRIPSEEQIMVAREVLKGNMGILNNDNVLFFRNANHSTQDWGKYPFFISVNNHQFYTLN